MMAESLAEAVEALYDFIETELEVSAAKKQALKALQLQVSLLMEKQMQGRGGRGGKSTTVRKRTMI